MTNEQNKNRKKTKRLKSTLKYVNDGEIEELFKKYEIVAVDFTASWCSPCHGLDSHMAEFGIDKKHYESAIIVKYDVDQGHPEGTVPIDEKLGITSIPTIAYFRNGKLFALSKSDWVDHSKIIDWILSGNKGIFTDTDRYLPKIENGIVEYLVDRRQPLSDKRYFEIILEEKEKFAKEKGWILNPNEKARDGIIRILVKNKKKYDVEFCPCKGELIGVQEVINGKKVFVSECPCVDVEEEIEENGHCHCHLFYKEE